MNQDLPKDWRWPMPEYFSSTQIVYGNIGRTKMAALRDCRQFRYVHPTC